MSVSVIEPEWQAPTPVRALCTTRRGGYSTGDYSSFNLADHVGDDPVSVARNRARLHAQAALPSEPRWLAQVHGCDVAVLGGTAAPCEADAAVSDEPGSVCAVLTADCLPILLCDDEGGVVAAVHAGWRGLAAGVIEAAVRHMDRAPSRLMAWLGPAIGPSAFEVGDEVRECFRASRSEAVDAFRPGVAGRWLADLPLLARQRLAAIGVERVWGGRHCTFREPELFYSYRREGVTGRMATLIWLDA